MDKKQFESDRQRYEELVTEAAEAILDNLDPDDDTIDFDDQLREKLDGYCHDWQELDPFWEERAAFLALVHSSHPCQDLWSNGSSGYMGDISSPTDDFPFSGFATEAFEQDIRMKIVELTEHDHTCSMEDSVRKWQAEQGE